LLYQKNMCFLLLKRNINELNFGLYDSLFTIIIPLKSITIKLIKKLNLFFYSILIMSLISFHKMKLIDVEIKKSQQLN